MKQAAAQSKRTKPVDEPARTRAFAELSREAQHDYIRALIRDFNGWENAIREVAQNPAAYGGDISSVTDKIRRIAAVGSFE